ncbi:hypothetical protein P7K49_013188 [Saguinus oedipus]|uniref:Uncharacterized protein n=1 Tax=Saguinus oedipus TaxID=9490 RepID=A0ABQ9VHB6_SAGOE|nr:hypothetical protein P7K49_013188 [Saguinus oedipus]
MTECATAALPCPASDHGGHRGGGHGCAGGTADCLRGTEEPVEATGTGAASVLSPSAAQLPPCPQPRPPRATSTCCGDRGSGAGEPCQRPGQRPLCQGIPTEALTSHHPAGPLGRKSARLWSCPSPSRRAPGRAGDALLGGHSTLVHCHPP